MNSNSNRRQFLKRSALAAGALALASAGTLLGQTAAKRTAVDEVTLGLTGLKLSRLGMGTGSDSGHVQTALGRDGFNKLIHYAYDQGIRYFDCAESYATFTWMAGAIKGLPRERLFIQSKIDHHNTDILAAIDRHRKIFNTDYIDSMLVHCMVRHNWTDEWKRAMDGFDEARDKKWILAKGVSCHTLPALRASTASNWTEVHLVRVNPQGRRVDGMDEIGWFNDDPAHDIRPVLVELKKMRVLGRGVIGMKIIGDGHFIHAEDREKSIRFAMSLPELDAVVIGFKNAGEIDEAIQRMNSALAAPA
jgi:hypothetical protein